MTSKRKLQQTGCTTMTLTSCKSQKQACGRKWASVAWREGVRGSFGKGGVCVRGKFEVLMKARIDLSARTCFEDRQSNFRTTVAVCHLQARYVEYSGFRTVGRCLYMPGIDICCVRRCCSAMLTTVHVICYVIRVLVRCFPFVLY